MLRRGDLPEVGRVLRRRALNGLKPVRRLLGRWLRPLRQPSTRKRRQQQLQALLKKYYDWPALEHTPKAKTAALILHEGTSYPKSSAFIRLISPLSDPSLRGKLRLKLLAENCFDAGQDIDWCIVQRNAVSSLPAAKQLAANLAKAKVPLIIDTDDAFHEIDSHHPEAAEHRRSLPAFNYLVDQAAEVWVSTPRLAASFKNLAAKVVVVPNSLDKRLWPTAKIHRAASRRLQLLYMGTVSHDADFALILPALDQLADSQPDGFELTLIGAVAEVPDRPWLKRLYAPRDGTVYPRFVPWLAKQGPFDVGLSPLVDSDFNRNKSDIKCLDYLALGLTPVVSSLEPYQTPELANYIIPVKNDPKVWHKALSVLVANRRALRREKTASAKAAQRYLWQERSSSQTSRQLWHRLQKLTRA